MFVIQTDKKFPEIKDFCLKSWADIAKSKGYSILTVDFRSQEGTFLDILINACEESKTSMVIIGFDDLYCSKFTIPSLEDLKKIFEQYSPDVVRLDGRVPGLGAYSFSIDDTKYYCHTGMYQCSTVFSAFSKDFLIACRDNGVASAWDLEKVSSPNIRAFAPRKRTIKYDNYIVKGRIDPTIQNSKLFISYRHALRRKLYRLVTRSIRYIAVRLTFR
tara:strand:- start:511 stop:1161 length:651 start_codon:yes stop_codon:yes gene_type:complete